MIQQYIKRIIHDQVGGLFQRCKVVSILKINQWNHHVKKVIISVDTEKSTWQNSASIHDQNSQKNRNRGKFPQHNKGQLQKIYS